MKANPKDIIQINQIVDDEQEEIANNLSSNIFLYMSGLTDSSLVIQETFGLVNTKTVELYVNKISNSIYPQNK